MKVSGCGKAQAGLNGHIDAIADELPLGGHGFVDDLEEVRPFLYKDPRLRVGIGFSWSQGNVCSQLEVLNFPTLEIRTAWAAPAGTQMIEEQRLRAVVAHGKGGGDNVHACLGRSGVTASGVTIVRGASAVRGAQRRWGLATTNSAKVRGITTASRTVGLGEQVICALHSSFYKRILHQAKVAATCTRLPGRVKLDGWKQSMWRVLRVRCDDRTL